MRVQPLDHSKTTCTIDPLGSHRLLFTLTKIMKQNRMNWIWLLVGLLGGLAIGVLLICQETTRPVEERITEHSMAVDNTAFGIERAMRTIRGIETKNYDSVLSEERLFLSGAFLSLVEMHKQGMIDEDDWVKTGILLRAKDLILEHKEIHLGQKFATETSTIGFINEDISNPVDKNATDASEDRLKKALQYVERIQQEDSSIGQPVDGGQ